MKTHGRRSSGVAIMVLALAAAPVGQACTIFVLTDGTSALFFNNEDWLNPATRIWFVPAGEGHLGCAYVGFDDDWAQGGVNTAGLAFDWVSGFNATWAPAVQRPPVRGNPAQRMLETCRTVDEAVQFFRDHHEPDFSRSRILVADRTGKSAVMGARDGEFHAEIETRSRGFGWGGATVRAMLAEGGAPSLDRGREILSACVQAGEGGTKYSTVYDLRSGIITVFPDVRSGEGFVLNLAGELAKGGHFYDIPHLREQIAVAVPRPLTPGMKRFYLDEWPPIEDERPQITARVRRLLEAGQAGAMRAEDFTPELWAEVRPHQNAVAADLRRLGDLIAVRLARHREETGGANTFFYRVEYEKIDVLQSFTFTAEGKLAALRTEFREIKPGQTL